MLGFPRLIEETEQSRRFDAGKLLPKLSPQPIVKMCLLARTVPDALAVIDDLERISRSCLTVLLTETRDEGGSFLSC